MTTPCNKTARLQLRRSEGESLSPEEARFLSSHLAACEACTAEEMLLALLTSDSTENYDASDDLTLRREQDAVLSALDARRRRADSRPTAGRNTKRLIGGTAAACAVIGVSAALIVALGDAAPSGGGPAGTVTREGRAEGPRTGRPTLQPAHRDVLKTGGDSTTLDLGGEIRVMLQPHTTAAVQRRGAEGISIDLSAGEVLASLSPDRERAPFRVRTRAGEVIVTGTVFSVTVSPASVAVSVARGHVLVRRPSTADVHVDAGEAMRIDSDGKHALTEEELALLRRSADALQSGVPAASTTGTPAGKRPAEHRARKRRDSDTPPPRALLTHADELRNQRRFSEAVSAYEQLQQRYPRRAESRLADIALGELYLDHLKNPRRAYDCYRRYLSKTPTGPLAQEAAYGEIQALRRMGRTEEERNRLEQFLERYPSAVQKQQVQQRLEAIGGRGGDLGD